MRKAVIILVLLVLVGFGVWSYFGGIDRVTERRVETALADNGVPPATASCMAERMVDRLSLGQLVKLEGLSASAGDVSDRMSLNEFVDRVRRMEDAEIIEVTASSAGICAIRERLR